LSHTTTARATQWIRTLRERPKLTFRSITFSDGQSLELNEDDIIVFVGPNNAGKSAALRELEYAISRDQPQKVISSAKLSTFGDPGGFRDWLQNNSILEGQPGNYYFKGMGYSIHESHVTYLGSGSSVRDPIASFFASRVGTDTRLVGSDPAGPINLHFAPATHPIHMLLADSELASKMSGLFARAFGKDLTVFRGGGSSFPLMAGRKPSLQADEDELSKRYIRDLPAASEPLQEQGDGMRAFATVLLHVLVAENYSVQFLDEPEAFLHPPQARLLGELIAKERRSKTQLFVATHSPEVLEGILSADSTKVRIVRIQRDGAVNRIKELGKIETAAIATDPLTRYSRVLSGIFHERVIIAESETDCLFYAALLDTKYVSGTRTPDALFIHAGGKSRMQKLASLLRSLDVPVSVVADIDVLNDAGTFRSLLEALGGKWFDVERDWNTLNSAVIANRPPLNAEQVRSRIEIELKNVSGNQPFPKERERNIKTIFKSLSPWDQVKRLGKAGFDRGAPTTTFERLAATCGKVGLWIVAVGEIEGFCRSIEARHGPDFTEKVLSQRNLEVDPELREAREFVRKIWQ
jgi:hypothetical protein